jgi:peptidyl-prolyl cis-trans isomerase C
MIHTSRRLVALILGTTLLAAPAFAKETTPVAEVNGRAITAEAYRLQKSRLPAQYFEGAEAAKTNSFLLDELVNDALLSDAASKARIAETPAFTARVAEFKTYLARELYLRQLLEKNLTEDALRQAYAAQYEQGAQGKEVRARHILVKTKAEAEALIAQLQKGASFAELAKAQSTDISKMQGGDLGWFDYNTMVEPFAKAAFALEKGAYTRQPVETPFGWHVILVEDTRPKKAPPFETVRRQLQQQLQQQQIEAHLAALRKKATITVNQDVLKKLEQEKTAPKPDQDAGAMHHDHAH